MYPVHNFQMIPIFGILTFSREINSTSESFKTRNNFIFHFSLCGQLKFHAQLR